MGLDEALRLVEMSRPKHAKRSKRSTFVSCGPAPIPAPIEPRNCVGCGAPLNGSVCDYCKRKA